MKKIKIVQIGLNKHSHSNHIFAALKDLDDVFEIVGFVLPENEKERLSERYEEIKDYPEFSLDEVMQNPEIEAVIIETDEIYLFKYALIAAKHGKHIHMEKPGGIEHKEYEEIVSIMKQTGKVFHTGYMYRYNPAVKEVIDKAKSGQLGDIISIESNMNCWHCTETRNWLKCLPGGMTFFLGCHLIDIIYQIQGKPKRIISCNKPTGIDNVSSIDFGMVVLEYDKGFSFVKVTDTELGGYNRRQLVISGTKGTIELDPIEIAMPAKEKMFGTISALKKECYSTAWLAKGEEFQYESFGRYNGMMLAFADYVRGVKENPFTCDYELELHKLLLECCK